MSATRCIARAYADEPLDRMAVAYEKGKVFIASCSAVEKGDISGALGFPEDHVFQFDADLLERLQRGFLLDEPGFSEIWASAKRLEADLPLLERAQ